MNEKKLNTDLMTNNILKERMGVVPLVDVASDMTPKPKYDNNSWFAFGRYEVENHVFNYLLHVMELKLGQPMGTKCQTVITVFDETTGDYYAKDYLLDGSDIKMDESDFYIEASNLLIAGTWDKMKIQFSENDFQLNIEATAIHYPVITRGSSYFEVLQIPIYQFSVPYMKTVGTFKYKNQTYDLTDKGYTWFDRQWQPLGGDSLDNPDMSMRWSWMAIMLDTGDTISIFDCDIPGEAQTFSSILQSDGTQMNLSKLTPFKNGEMEYWYSESSRQNYPVHWNIKIEPVDAELEIIPIIKEQEIVSVMPQFNKYEGVCNVTGTYKGKEVKGHALVELIGPWPK